MPEGRMLKKKIGKTKELSRLNDIDCCLVYTWLIPHLDIEGRYYGEPEIIKGEVFPRLKKMTLYRIEKALTKLSTTSLVVWYRSNNGDRFLYFSGFKKEQKLREDREAKSNIPAPTSDQLQSNSRVGREDSRLSKVKESKVKISKDIPYKELYPSFPNNIKPLINDYIELARLENKTKTITEGRKLRLITEIFDFYKEAGQEQFYEALKITCDKQAPNINYLKKVLKNLRKKPQEKKPVSRVDRGGKPTSTKEALKNMGYKVGE